MTIPREAIEAAVDEWLKARPNLHATEPEIRALYERDMTRAITAALPHLLAAQAAQIAALLNLLRQAKAYVHGAALTVAQYGETDHKAIALEDAIRAALEMSGGVDLKDKSA